MQQKFDDTAITTEQPESQSLVYKAKNETKNVDPKFLQQITL